jgi:hypothetical protein
MEKLKTFEEFVNESKTLNESDAYTISRMANDIGLGHAQNFLDKHDVNIKLLTKDISQGTINKYELRDIIRGNAQSSKIKKFMKTYVNESINKSSEVKQIEKIVKKYFSDAKYDSSKYQWTAKTKVNPKDNWAQPLDLIKFDNEASKKWYSFLAGNSWDNDGNIIIKLRSNKLLESEDHEVKMSTNQLEAVINSALDLKEKIGEMEKDIPAWIQDHISQAYNYLKQANDGYHELDESINTRLRSEIFVNLKRAGFVPDEDFEYAGSQLLAIDMETAKEIVDDLSDKYEFSIQDKRITKEGKVPINVGKK